MIDKRSLYAFIVGVVLYVVLIYLASIQKELTGHQLFLILVTPLVMGIISGKVKVGLVLGFVVSLVMLIAEAAIVQSGAFANFNVAFAIVLMALPFALLSAGLGAVGGLIGKKVLKRRLPTEIDTGIQPAT